VNLPALNIGIVGGGSGRAMSSGVRF